MTIELWLAVGAAALLVVAGAARVAALRTGSRRGNSVALGARLAAAAVLLASLVVAALTRGGWSALDLQQVALGLAEAATIIHLAIGLRSKEKAGNPVADMVALTLVLIAVLAIRPGVPPTACIHHTLMVQVQWIAFLLAGGAIIVAASAGLMLALAAALAGRGWALPRRDALHTELKESTKAGLVILSIALTLTAVWSWRTMGALTSGDPRETWMAATWLIAAMSVQAWHLPSRPARWAACLAVAAAGIALFALLALPDLVRVIGS